MTIGEDPSIKVPNCVLSIFIVGVSTSGMPHKHPGRVGDSALPGNGLYAGKSITDILVLLEQNAQVFLS